MLVCSDLTNQPNLYARVRFSTYPSTNPESVRTLWKHPHIYTQIIQEKDYVDFEVKAKWKEEKSENEYVGSTGAKIFSRLSHLFINNWQAIH